MLNAAKPRQCAARMAGVRYFILMSIVMTELATVRRLDKGDECKVKRRRTKKVQIASL